MTRSSLVFGTAVQTLLLVAVSCGVPTGESSFEAIEAGDINDSTTTTTATTTTTTTTTIPELPASTVAATTSTTTEVIEDQVEIFFLSRGFLQPVSRNIAELYGFDQLISLLEFGPPTGVVGVGLDSVVEAGLIVGQPSTDRGVVTVDLDEDVFNRIIGRNQRKAIAQIVFTLLENTAAVGQVTFTFAGEQFLAPTNAGPREFVTTADFPSLQPGGTRPTPTGDEDEDDLTPSSATTTSLP